MNYVELFRVTHYIQNQMRLLVQFVGKRGDIYTQDMWKEMKVLFSGFRLTYTRWYLNAGTFSGLKSAANNSILL